MCVREVMKVCGVGGSSRTTIFKGINEDGGILPFPLPPSDEICRVGRPHGGVVAHQFSCKSPCRFGVGTLSKLTLEIVQAAVKARRWSEADADDGLLGHREGSSMMSWC